MTDPIATLKSKFAGYKPPTLPSFPGTQSMVPKPSPTLTRPPSLAATNAKVAQSTAPATPVIPTPTAPTTTKGQFGTIQDINGGKVYSDPRDNPNFNPVTPALPGAGTPAPQVGTPGTNTGTNTDTNNGTATSPAKPALPPDAQASVSAAEKAYQDSLAISPEQLSTQEDIDRLIESTKKAYVGIQDKPIPLDFITGQLASVERRATNLAEPLEKKLARLQAARTASLESSKFALDRADKKAQAERDANKPISGDSFYDPVTGTFKQAPVAPKAKEDFTLSPGELRYDAQGNLIASGGAKPMSDAAETKALEKADAETAKTTAALDSVNLINNLLKGNISGITGIGQNPLNFLGLTNQTEINQYKQLVSKLSLDARSLIKGSGAISDFEAKTLQSAASALGRNLSNADQVAALKQARGALMSNAGQSVTVKITDPSDGTSDTVVTTRDGISQAIIDGMVIEYQ